MTVPGHLYHPLCLSRPPPAACLFKTLAGIGVTEGQFRIKSITEKQARDDMWANVHIGPCQM
ncbi:Hypothetical protein GbCGDNIH3_7286 [Granulibacter bethesdensis]|uniref:Uncharacterized protein n=1 Tax=Granulibacter bethesdensis TaxID=364410 RepID=A0AAN0RE72_9PROT|nr:Hypothetical protein GbCGDNIH3_7286 [Granulibacter bethesdensis]